MSTKVFHIELRVTGIDTQERMLAITDALRAAGRQVHAAATLICPDNAPPEVMLYGEDLMDGRTDYPLEAKDG